MLTQDVPRRAGMSTTLLFTLFFFLALMPLGWSLLRPSTEESLQTRIEKAIDEHWPGTGYQVWDQLQAGKLSPDQVLGDLPGSRLPGALLPRTSRAHWGFAALSLWLFAVIIFVQFLRVPVNPLPIILSGLFTATVGIVGLTLVQYFGRAALVGELSGTWFVEVIVWFIGFSYYAALDPEVGFFLSFFGFTFGVGLFEELCKVVPVVSYYRHHDAPWQSALLWGFGSGVGFGVIEGLLYSADQYHGIVALDMYVIRFVSCVALHSVFACSTALSAYVLRESLRHVTDWYGYPFVFGAILWKPMVLHGLFDTLLKKEMNPLAFQVALMSVALVAWQIYRLERSEPVIQPVLPVQF